MGVQSVLEVLVIRRSDSLKPLLKRRSSVGNGAHTQFYNIAYGAHNHEANTNSL